MNRISIVSALIVAFLSTGALAQSGFRSVLNCTQKSELKQSRFKIVTAKGKFYGIYGVKGKYSKKTNYIRFNCRTSRVAKPGTAPHIIFQCSEVFHKNHTLNGPIMSVVVTAGGFNPFPNARVYSELPMPAGSRVVDSLSCQYPKR